TATWHDLAERRAARPAQRPSPVKLSCGGSGRPDTEHAIMMTSLKSSFTINFVVADSGELSMRSRCVEIMTGIALLVLSGCEDPGPIVPIAPPGANIPRVSPDTSPAEATGQAITETGGVPAAVAAAAAY